MLLGALCCLMGYARDMPLGMPPGGLGSAVPAGTPGQGGVTAPLEHRHQGSNGGGQAGGCCEQAWLLGSGKKDILLTRSHFLAKKGKADKNILKNSSGRSVCARTEKEPGPSGLKGLKLLPALCTPTSPWSAARGGTGRASGSSPAPSSSGKPDSGPRLPPPCAEGTRPRAHLLLHRHNRLCSTQTSSTLLPCPTAGPSASLRQLRGTRRDRAWSLHWAVPAGGLARYSRCSSSSCPRR